MAVRLSVAAVMAIAGAATLWFASMQTARADVHTADLAELELIALRTDLTRVQRDELTARLGEVFGLRSAEDVAVAQTDRMQVVAGAPFVLQQIAVDPGIGRDRQRELLESLEEIVPSGPDPAPFALYTGATQFENVVRPSSPSDPTAVDAMQQAAWLDVGSQLVLHEALIVAFGESPVAADPATANFFDLAGAFIRGEGELFGPDETSPLTNGAYWFEAANVHEAELVAVVDAMIAETSLWDIDERNGRFGLGDLGPMPADLETVFEESVATTASARLLIDQRLDVRAAESRDAADAAESIAGLARYVATALLAVAVAAASFAAVGKWRRTRDLHKKVNIDPLTGVGNRNLLLSKTTQLLADAGLGHHTVVVIDMDRFKMVNDTYGHAAGDRLLCEVAAGLEVVAEKMGVGGSTVVRLGGDEFTMTLHDNDRIDLDALSSHLDDLRGQEVSIEGASTLPIDFSYGMTHAVDSPVLDDLLEAADLAAYEQKSLRRQPEPIDLSQSAATD